MSSSEITAMDVKSAISRSYESAYQQRRDEDNCDRVPTAARKLKDDVVSECFDELRVHVRRRVAMAKAATNQQQTPSHNRLSICATQPQCDLTKLHMIARQSYESTPVSYPPSPLPHVNTWPFDVTKPACMAPHEI